MSKSTSPVHFGYNFARTAVQLDNGIAHPSPRGNDFYQDETVAHWQGLVDADLIGNRTPCPPEVAAQREANDALFRGYARDRYRAARL